LKVCTNCGEEAAEVFCARCGEKQPGHHDLTVGHFAHDFVHELVHLDSKLFRTLRELVTKPGHLTAEYFAGRKTRYITPLRLFITLFAIHFLAYTFYQPTSMYSVARARQFDKAGALSKMLEKKAAKYGMSVEAYAEKVDARWQKNISLMQFVNLAGIALVLQLLYRRRGRHFVEHLVFAAHFLAFGYILRLLEWPIFAIGGLQPGPLQTTIGVITFLIVIVYLYRAVRRFYGPEKAYLKTVLLWAGSVVTYLLIVAGTVLAAMLQYR